MIDRWHARNKLFWLQDRHCRVTAIETAAPQERHGCVGCVRLQCEVNGPLQSCIEEDLSHLYHAGGQGHDGLQRRPPGGFQHVCAIAHLLQPC